MIEDRVRRLEELVRELQMASTRSAREFRTAAAPESGGGCDTQNAIWDIALLGNPGTGTIDLSVIVNAVTETKTFPYNCSAADFKTELATHAEIDAADLTVTGQWPNSTMRCTFGGALAGQDILQPTADWSGLGGGAGLGVICMLAQKGHS